MWRALRLIASSILPSVTTNAASSGRCAASNPIVASIACRSLLNSCATPPASAATVSSRCASCTCAASLTRSVTSRPTAWNSSVSPATSPSARNVQATARTPRSAEMWLNRTDATG